jgi:hypothetical protein
LILEAPTGRACRGLSRIAGALPLFRTGTTRGFKTNLVGRNFLIGITAASHPKLTANLQIAHQLLTDRV